MIQNKQRIDCDQVTLLLLLYRFAVKKGRFSAYSETVYEPFELEWN
jgi:hypothetical protein